MAGGDPKHDRSLQHPCPVTGTHPLMFDVCERASRPQPTQEAECVAGSDQGWSLGMCNHELGAVGPDWIALTQPKAGRSWPVRRGSPPQHSGQFVAPVSFCAEGRRKVPSTLPVCGALRGAHERSALCQTGLRTAAPPLRAKRFDPGPRRRGRASSRPGRC